MSTSDSTDGENQGSKLHERFASVVAHELRNPLSAVKIALQTVGRGDALPAKDATRLDIALREVGTIERVLDLILEWARPSDLLVEETTVEDALRQISIFSADALDECGVTLEVAVDDAFDDATNALHVDVVRLAFAVSELVRNAAFASPPNGVVELQCVRDANGVVFIVRDHGEGLQGGSREQVFEPFWANHARGVGLGLTVARDVAQRHQGTLVLNEDSVQGCVALLSVPNGKHQRA